MRRSTTVAVTTAAIAAAVGASLVLRALVWPGSEDLGLVTNEYAHWNASAGAVRDDTWDVTGGSLFRLEGDVLWTGVPDAGAPDHRSAEATGSAVFRALHGDSLTGDTEVALSFRIDDLVDTAKTPARAWDGLHVFLRYDSEVSLYYVSVARRDAKVAIKKKVPGGSSNGGTYYTLEEAPGRPAIGNGWHRAAVTIRDLDDGAVELSLSIDGRPVAVAVDDGVGGPVIRSGRVGLRGDNAEIRIRELQVRVGARGT